MRTNLTKLGAQALNIIERVTAEKQSHGDQNGETSAATSTFERSANVDTLAPTEEHDDNEDSGDHHETPEPVLTTQVPAPSCYSVCLLSSGWVPPTPDRGLSEKEKAAILRVFEREITAGTKVTKEIAQKRCCTTAVLTILATSMSKVKTVVNHVNSIIQTRPRSPPPPPRQVRTELQNFDDPSTRSSGRRQEWHEDDSKAIEKAFEKCTTLPTTTQTKQVFKQDTKTLRSLP